MDVNVQKQCVKVFTTEGVINMQPLLVLTQDLTGVAQEDTLVQGISDIRGDIANIDIDTSTLAKEQTLTDGIGAIRGDIANISIDTSTLAQRTDVKDGNDTAISVSKEIRSEVGTGSDTAAETGTLFAVLKWVKDKVKSIYNLIGTPGTGQPSTLFGAVGDIALSATTLQSLADSWAAMVTNRSSLDGWTAAENYSIDGVGSVVDLLFRKLLKSVDDSTLTTFTGNSGYWNNCNYLENVILRGLTTAYFRNDFGNCIKLKEISFPIMYDVGIHSYFGVNCPLLERVYLPQANTTLSVAQSNGAFYNSPNLIDIWIGDANINISSFFKYWSPAEALLNNSTSLVKEGETFTSNLEKLLYNIREHIAGRLANRVGQSALTITFSAEVKAAIQADSATAAAFTNKNWTVA